MRVTNAWGTMGRMTPNEPKSTEPTDRPSNAELRDLCVRLAEGAAELVASRRAALTEGGRAIASQSKSSEVDPVTEVDKAAERHIVERLAALRPGDGVLGEEGANRASATGVEWIVDPIDGTVNFLYGLPSYAVSVAAAVDGRLVAGAVHNAATGESYSAAAGLGATVRRGGTTSAIGASRAAEVSRALVATGFSYDAGWRRRQADMLSAVLPEVRDIRRMGSAALDLCAVAEGRVDAYYEHGTHPWDWAAGAVIASEAGAAVHHPGLRDEEAPGAVVTAAAPGIAADLAGLLDAAGALNPLG